VRDKLLKDLAAAETAAEQEWEAADLKVNKELQKKEKREGETLTILREILEEHQKSITSSRKGSSAGASQGTAVKGCAYRCTAIYILSESDCASRIPAKPEWPERSSTPCWGPSRICSRSSISAARSPDEQTDDAIETFKETAVEFGIIWRELFGSALPRVRCLETHRLEQFEFSECLGKLTRMCLRGCTTNIRKVMAMLNYMKFYVKRETYLNQRRAAMNTNEVVCWNVWVDANLKRKFSSASLARRKERMKLFDKDILAKVEAADLFLGKSAYDPIVKNDE